MRKRNADKADAMENLSEAESGHCPLLPHTAVAGERTARVLSVRSECDDVSAPGMFCGPKVLWALGFDTTELPEDIAHDIDVVMAALWARLFALFDDQEEHRALFLRHEKWLADRFPRHAAMLQTAWRAPPALDPVRALFFEDFARWLYQMLCAESETIQPAWLSAHAVHADDDRPHQVRGSLAPLCDPTASLEDRLLLVETWLYDTLLLDVSALALALLHRGVRIARPPLRDLPIYAAVLEHPAFRRTRDLVLHPPTLGVRR